MMSYDPNKPQTPLGNVGSILNQINGTDAALVHTSEINREQWERETAYNSPVEQMKRLREAGLNPDLMYGNGGAANTASSAQLTSGTPQSRGVMHGISQALNAAANLSLIDSEKEKNYAEASLATSRTGETDVNTAFKLKTFDEACRAIFLQNNFTEHQIKNATALNEQIQMRTFEIEKNIQLIGDQQQILDASKVIKWNEARISGSQVSYFLEQAKHAKDYFDGLVGTMQTQMKVDGAYASLLRGQYHLLVSTFDSQVNLQRNMSNFWSFHAGNERQLWELSKTNAEAAKENLKFLPFMYANAMYQSELCYEHDKDGNIVFDDDGLPKINVSYVNYQRFMGNLQQGLDAFESFTNSLKNVGIGYGAMRGFSIDASKSPSPTPAQSSPVPFRSNHPRGSKEYISDYWKHVNGH